MLVIVALLAAVGAPFGWSYSWSLPVTGEAEWKVLSSLLSDVCWTPRLVAWAELMRDVGFLVEGKEENKSYLTGFVALLFAGLLDF